MFVKMARSCWRLLSIFEFSICETPGPVNFNFYLPIIVSLHWLSILLQPVTDCQQVPLKQCAKYIKGTSSWQAQFPNYFGHTKEEAIANLKLFDPIWPFAESKQSDCASTLAHFLCNMYAPQCVKSKSRIPPCKELCLSARSKCKSSLKQVRKESGFTWPKDIACKNFPRSGTAPCYMTTNPTTSTGQGVAPVTNAPPSSGRIENLSSNGGLKYATASQSAADS